MEAPGTSVGVWLRSCEQLPTAACSGLALKPLGPGTTPSPESRLGVSRSPGEHAVSYSISGCRAPGMSFGLLKTLACGWSFSSWEPRHLWTASWLMVEGSLTSTSQGPAPQAESDPLTDTPASRHPLSKTSCPACFLGHAHSTPRPHAASPARVEPLSLSLSQELPPQEPPKLHTPTCSGNKPQGRGWTSCLCTETLSVPRTSEASCPQVGLASPTCAELCTPPHTPRTLPGFPPGSPCAFCTSLSVEAPSPVVSPTSALGHQILPSIPR